MRAVRQVGSLKKSHAAMPSTMRIEQHRGGGVVDDLALQSGRGRPQSGDELHTPLHGCRMAASKRRLCRRLVPGSETPGCSLAEGGPGTRNLEPGAHFFFSAAFAFGFSVHGLKFSGSRYIA